jgi:hypothetical protein
MEEKQEEEPIEQEQEKKKQIRVRSPKAGLQQCADELSAIAADKNTKPNGRVDALIRKADILTELARLVAKEKESEAIAENENLTRQHVEDFAKIAELEAQVSALKASQHPVEIREIPDARLPETLALNMQQADLIQNAAQAIRENVEEPTRLKMAAVLVKKMGRNAQPFVSDIVDFASVYAASTRTDDELQSTIDSAFVGSRGAAVLVARATLAARGVPVIGPRSSKPVYADVFDQADHGTFCTF